jgi:diguanylate cyclase (GGDEF)-like protein
MGPEHPTVDGWLDRASPAVILALGLVLVALIGAADVATGAELSSSVFYAVPVALATWYGSLRLGLFMCLAASGTWYAADVAAGGTYSASWIPFWNTGVRLTFFVIIAVLMVRLRRALEAQRDLAERDGLTGLANGRRFLSAVDIEVSRSHRYRRPLSLAYIDLDGFKAVNDSLGHGAGDDVLEMVGTILSRSLRAADLPARLGGDEFAVLLPEADADRAKEAAAKLRVVLETAMTEGGWPVGFSMGVYTSKGGVADADGLLRKADALMYEVKRSGKGDTLFRAEGE